MNEYLIDDISKLSIYQKENNIEEYNKFVKETAMSDISNKYFARPWENHIEIVYWQGFLDVLFSRGIDNIQNVKNDLLEWLDDPCRLGFAEVCDFIVQNKNQFIPLLKRKIIHEFYNKEFQYVIHLVLVYNKCTNLPKDIDSIVNKLDEFDIEGINEDNAIYAYKFVSMSLEFNWEEELPLLADDCNEVQKFVIERFAKSDLPNDFFVQQFDLPAKKPFCDKKYWRSFAKILTSRKLENTPEIYKKLLIWLQDINWPGSDIIFNFVVENINDFSYSIKETLLEALYNNDDVWIISILTAVYKNKGLTNKEINGQLEKVQKLLINENNLENLIKLFDDILD